MTGCVEGPVLENNDEHQKQAQPSNNGMEIDRENVTYEHEMEELTEQS